MREVITCGTESLTAALPASGRKHFMVGEEFQEEKQEVEELYLRNTVSQKQSKKSRGQILFVEKKFQITS